MENLSIKDNQIEENKKFESQDSVYFKITTSDKNLRDLMNYIRQEGIISQNSFSSSSQLNSLERTFSLWVDKEDENKIKKWLIDKSFTN